MGAQFHCFNKTVAHNRVNKCTTIIMSYLIIYVSKLTDVKIKHHVQTTDSTGSTHAAQHFEA